MINATWQDKAHRLIYNACSQSYEQAQISRLTGKRYRSHVPYSVPQFAEDLIDCLNRNDEEKAKALFLSYEGMKLL